MVVICTKERPAYLDSSAFERTWHLDPLGASPKELQHNAQVKVYPDGSASVLVSDRRIFRESGWEVRGRATPEVSDKSDTEDAGEDPKGPDPENVARARRRARAALSDFARSTPFAWFVTLTLDASRIDRYDMRVITRKLNQWLDNAVRRRGLAYVLVPEYHKKDKAVHFHGLMTDALDFKPSGTYKLPDQYGKPAGKPRKPRSKRQELAWREQGAQEVYNLPAWPYGFSTALRLYGDYRAAIGYVCKYIGKDSEKIGGRWYYSGGPLGRPSVLAADLDFDALVDMAGEGSSFAIGELGARAARLDVAEGGDLFGVLEYLANPGTAP